MNGRPYGVDVIIPTTYDAQAEASIDDLAGLIPQAQRDFINGILASEGVPELPAHERERVHDDIARGRGGMTPTGARRLVNVALQHPAGAHGGECAGCAAA